MFHDYPPPEEEAVADQPPTSEERVTMWRLESLVRAYSKQVVAIDEQDVAGLEKLAASKADVYDVIKAFKAGRTVEQAAGIFL